MILVKQNLNEKERWFLTIKQKSPIKHVKKKVDMSYQKIRFSQIIHIKYNHVKLKNLIPTLPLNVTILVKYVM